jgi:hypothetical protein
MTCSKYLKKKGCTLSITLIARLQGYTDVGLVAMYDRGELDRLEELVFDAEARFSSVCKSKKGDKIKPVITEDEINKGMDFAYKQAGKNAFFGNGFVAGVKFAESILKHLVK